MRDPVEASGPPPQVEGGNEGFKREAGYLSLLLGRCTLATAAPRSVSAAPSPRPLLPAPPPTAFPFALSELHKTSFVAGSELTPATTSV